MLTMNDDAGFVPQPSAVHNRRNVSQSRGTWTCVRLYHDDDESLAYMANFYSSITPVYSPRSISDSEWSIFSTLTEPDFNSEAGNSQG